MMYSRDKRETIQVVKIDFVDIGKSEIFCSSKDGGRFTIKIPVGDGVYRIPKSGENWMISRENINSWSFKGVVLTGQEEPRVLAQEGDLVLESPSEIKIATDALYLNNDVVGIWEYEEFDVNDNETVQIELSNMPTSTVIQVFNNGLLMPPSGIIIVEQALLFQNALDPGKAVVYYMRLPEQ